MTDRADYIRGLCELASLLANHAELSLPYYGHAGGRGLPTFLNNPSAVTHALTFIQAMDEPPTLELKRQSSELTWLEISGRIKGLRVLLDLRAHEVCERRVTDDATGEVVEWVIPAELLAAARGDDTQDGA